MLKVKNRNTADIYIYIYIYMYVYKYVYIPWTYERDLSLIPLCIHQLFLQTNTCSEVIKEHKKKGWNLFVITTLKVITTLISVLLPLFLILNIFKNFFLCLCYWYWAYIGFYFIALQFLTSRFLSIFVLVWNYVYHDFENFQNSRKFQKI